MCYEIRDSVCYPVFLGKAAEITQVPHFIRVDARKKTLSGERAGVEETTAIDQFVNDQGLLILQGVEQGRGWTMLISEATGRMSMTITASEAGFVMFGACMRP